MPGSSGDTIPNSEKLSTVSTELGRFTHRLSTQILKLRFFDVCGLKGGGASSFLRIWAK